MKQGNALVNFVMIALAVALACYLGVYAWDSFNDPFTTTYAYEYVSSEAVEAQGFLARAERVFSPKDGIVDVTRGEGEKVGKGQTVALVHRDSQAVELQAEMDQLALEISLLDYALGEGDGEASAARLDETVLQSMVELRGAAAVNDYSQLEDQVQAVKSQVLKRDYTYGQGLEMSQLQQQRQDLVAQHKALRSQSTGATSRITAPEAGTFSALVDGSESLLTPESILTLTPSQVDALEDQRVADEGAPGKIITSNVWYFVTVLSETDAKRLRSGNTVTVRFSGDFDQDVDMTVEQVGEAENGRCALVLSSDRYLKETMLLRIQSAEIIFELHSGLRVPKTCLRMITK
ncbi:MAG: hypothetical protein IJX52_03220, partial [Oscillibacter sp.]|nr:hypothetical protein [Oscillibacter sp.]